jgi:hypothetical protein
MGKNCNFSRYIIIFHGVTVSSDGYVYAVGYTSGTTIYAYGNDNDGNL